MASLDREICSMEFSSCRPDDDCRCEFDAPLTRIIYQGLEALGIMEVHFGEAPADGLRFGATSFWWGPLHEGKGIARAIVGKPSGEAQRQAVISILSGEQQKPIHISDRRDPWSSRDRRTPRFDD